MYWFELQGNVHLQGVVFPASASLRGRRSAKVGVECVCVCVKLKLTLHQRHRKFSQSSMKVCVMPSEISTQQLFFMVADAFTGVRFQYKHFSKLAVLKPTSSVQQKPQPQLQFQEQMRHESTNFRTCSSESVSFHQNLEESCFEDSASLKFLFPRLFFFIFYLRSNGIENVRH